jgi:hypothetical protein
MNAAWRFGVGTQHQATDTFLWGCAVEYAYGGSLDTINDGAKPVALGGRGDLVGSYEDTGSVFLALYGNWKF